MNNIEKQYKNADNLNTRISIHDKYSTNKVPFGNWIVSHYEIAPGTKVLELGCGTGSMWVKHLDLLPEGASLLLTDFSEGMLETARKNLPEQDNITFRVVNIQDIPYPDGSFDAVIANMMLYHVPDLHKGLSEVRRVLKPGGKFYCATYGEHGIVEFVLGALRHLNVSGGIGTTFTLQNGGETLGKHFSDVQRLDREDGLAITDIGDFADYIYSLSGLSNISSVPRDALMEALERKRENGILYVPKEYGMFICA